MTNPLVEQQPESNDGFITKGTGDQGWASGIGIAESVNDVSSLDEGSSWVESGLAYGGLAMEGVSMAVDPIGTLLSYGLSWLIEHVQPLKEALDWFAGDPDGVAAYGKTWENVSKAVEQAAQQYKTAVKADTADWKGAAGDAYRKTAAEKGEALAGAAKLAGTISSVVTIMGEVVSFVREFVRDLVADCISRLITYALEALLPPIASLAWVVPQAIAFISKTVTKIVDIVTKLTRTISNVSPKLAKLAEVFGDIMKTLGDKGKAGAGAISKVANKLDVAGRMGDKLAEKTWKKVDETFGTDVVGKHNAKFGSPDAPGGADSGDGGDSSSGSRSAPSSAEGRSTSSEDGSAPSARSGSTADSGGSGAASASDSPSGGGDSPRGDGDAGSGADGAGSTPSSSGQSHADSGSETRSSSGSSPDAGSGHSARADSDAGPSSRTDSSSNSAGSSPDSGGPARADAGSSPDSGSPRADAGSTPDPGGSPRADSASGPSRADSSFGGQSGSASGGAGTHTSDVPRAPAQTSAAAVDAPARPPETASPQATPAAPRPDQQSGAAPAGGANAPAGPSSPGNGAPSPRGGRQGSGGWTGTSGHPGAARNVPSHAPRTPERSAGPRPNGPAPAHAPRVGLTPPRQTPAPMRPARAGASHAQGSPVQRPPAAPPRPDHLRTADAPRTPIPAQRAPETSNSLPDHPKPDQPKVSTAESMAAETPPKDQWQAGHHKASHTPRFDISPELREKLGRDLREIEANRAGLSFTRPPKEHYFGRAEWARHRPQCSVDPDRYTVEMHGGPNGVKFKGHDLDAEELAEIIKGTPGYEEGTPIRLVSCETGADVPDGSKNFAQQLSEELGVEVLAPNTNAWVDNHGNIYASETKAEFDQDDTGTPRPRLDSPGEWTAFRPDGTKAVHSSPYPPGHQPEWVRHGVQADDAHKRGIFGRRKDEDFSADPVTGHNYSNAPPQAQHGPPPQNHGHHPQHQGYPQQPHHQGYPQQRGYPQQGYPQQPGHPQQQGYPQGFAPNPQQGFAAGHQGFGPAGQSAHAPNQVPPAGQQHAGPYQAHPQHSAHQQPRTGGYPQQGSNQQQGWNQQQAPVANNPYAQQHPQGVHSNHPGPVQNGPSQLPPQNQPHWQQGPQQQAPRSPHQQQAPATPHGQNRPHPQQGPWPSSQTPPPRPQMPEAPRRVLDDFDPGPVNRPAQPSAPNRVENDFAPRNNPPTPHQNAPQPGTHAARVRSDFDPRPNTAGAPGGHPHAQTPHSPQSGHLQTPRQGAFPGARTDGGFGPRGSQPFDQRASSGHQQNVGPRTDGGFGPRGSQLSEETPRVSDRAEPDARSIGRRNPNDHDQASEYWEDPEYWDGLEPDTRRGDIADPEPQSEEPSSPGSRPDDDPGKPEQDQEPQHWPEPEPLDTDHAPRNVKSWQWLSHLDRHDMPKVGITDGEEAWLRRVEDPHVEYRSEELRDGSTRPHHVEFADGSEGVYKRYEDRAFTFGDTPKREVAGSRLSEDLGFGHMTPRSVEWDGPKGQGVIQEWVGDAVPFDKMQRNGSASLNDFPIADRQRAAIFDYVSGNVDRNPGNFMARNDDNGLVLIDHGYCFPSSKDSVDYELDSPFIDEFKGQPLSDEVLSEIRNADIGRIGERLRLSGLSNDEINGAVSRLKEVQQHGMITGDAWGGGIRGTR